MIPAAEVTVNINQEQVKDFIEEQLQKQINQQLFLVDINKLSEMTCMSKSFLEQEILHDPRMKLLERRKEKGKRFWFYEESLNVIREIMDEWQ
ncbi:hypothetical protein LZD48_00340 [Oceanobacillus sp. APA_J-2(6-2)]|nr:hypothetical protein [Oceanobacillus alkalisoli]